MSRRMSRLPSTVESGTCPGTGRRTHPAALAGGGSHRRRNLDTMHWFSLLMLLFCLLRTEGEWENVRSFDYTRVSTTLREKNFPKSFIT